MRRPEKVVEEIDYLYHTYGVKTFKIIDEMFVLNDGHVDGICRRLAAKPYAHELNVWAYARVDTVKPDRLQMIREAGIRWLALGIESGSEHVRDGAEKSLDQQDIVDIVKAIRRAGINVIGNYIFGLPDDDRDTMQQKMKERGISAEIHYPVALPFIKAYQHVGHKPHDYPVAHRQTSRILSLPIYPELSLESVDYVCQIMRTYGA